MTDLDFRSLTDADLAKRPFDDPTNVTHVLPGRQLWNDAAPFTMDLDLGCDHTRPDAPGRQQELVHRPENN